MTRRCLTALLTLAATISFTISLQAAQLTFPGAPAFDQPGDQTGDQPGEMACDWAVPLDGPLARGRVVAVDKSAGRVTLEFRPILPFLPEGGRRVFHVEDAMSLNGLGPGDKV